MHVRVKKLIGLFVMLAWLFIYALIAMRIGVEILPDAHWAVTLGYYALAGFAWIVPLMPLIRWMNAGRGADEI